MPKIHERAPSPEALAKVKAMRNDEVRALIMSRVPPIEEPAEWHTPAELAPLMGVNPQAIMEQLRQLYPEHQGCWRLSRVEVERLVRRVVQSGKKVRFAVALMVTAPGAGHAHHVPVTSTLQRRRD